MSSFYDLHSKQVRLKVKERKVFKYLLETNDISLTRKNLQIHEEVFKVLCVIKSMDYKGVYSWSSTNQRAGSPSKAKYAFNKIKNNFITLGVIDKSGDFIEDVMFEKFKVSDFDIKLILFSDIETRLAVKGKLNSWNLNNKDKAIAAYKHKDKMVLEPITPFLAADFKYSLEIFKPISYRRAKEILQYLLDNN